MTLQDISEIRISNQKIASSGFRTAGEVVCWMGAMQAQDFPMAKWAIGLRLFGSNDRLIEEAYNGGEILRTHLMRPTWHFINAGDIYWMLELTAPQIKASLRSRHKNLEITRQLLAKSNRLIEEALSSGPALTREELSKEFGSAGINIEGNRLSHFLLCAELEGLICSGPVKKDKLTYMLLSERVNIKKSLNRSESSAELAKRYFTSHGPATLQDFIWWSGLRAREAREALEGVKPYLISETMGSEEYWLSGLVNLPNDGKDFVHLIPAYDELIISYKERNAALQFADSDKVISRNGIFYPVILVNGQVKGLWKRSIVKNKLIIETSFFGSVNKRIRNLTEEKAFYLGHFLNKEAELRDI